MLLFNNIFGDRVRGSKLHVYTLDAFMRDWSDYYCAVNDAGVTGHIISRPDYTRG